MEPEEKAARNILDTIYETYKPTHQYEVVNEKDFKHLDLGFYRWNTKFLEKNDFRHIGDVEDASLVGSTSKLFKRIMIRVLISNDGTIMAGLYHPKPKLWIGILLWFLRSLPGKIVDLESELSDSSFIVTSNAEAALPMSSPPLIYTEYLMKNTGIEAILERHHKRLTDYLRQKPTVFVKKVFSHSEVVASQNRMNAIKAAHRGELKGISKSEFDKFSGSQKVKDAIFDEIQKIQSENRPE